MKTFCKNQENLCAFETKFLNRQKKKRKSEKTGEKSGRKTVKMTDEGSKATEECMFVNSV